MSACTCQGPDADLLRPYAHEPACPIFIGRCTTCDGKGYHFKVTPKGSRRPAVTINCNSCNATGVTHGT